MVAMKHVGCNVPADVFMNSAQPFASDLLHIGKADILFPCPVSFETANYILLGNNCFNFVNSFWDRFSENTKTIFGY